MAESRKKDIAKDFIKENILNKELLETQWSFLSEINLLKQEIESIKNIDFNILWSEKPQKTSEFTKDTKQDFLLNNVMKILFNEKWKQRTKLGYEIGKIISPISDEWKKNLDLLYESLQKSKTEQELKDSLNRELSQLKNNISWDLQTENTDYSQTILEYYQNIENISKELTESENKELQKLLQDSQNPNNINYLDNNTYKKYLNIIESKLNLPKSTLESICLQESGWKLYKWNNLIWSSAGAKWLFQFMPSTADHYMKNQKLNENYWKIFSSRDDFLKDPLATARSAGLLISQNAKKYNLQTSLACYNRWSGNIQKNINWNLNWNNFKKLPTETQKYVVNITSNILNHNGINISQNTENILWYDLSKYNA